MNFFNSNDVQNFLAENRDNGTKKRHDVSAVLMLMYVASLAVLWFIAGQGAENFLPFVINATKFASIYNDAMTIYEPGNLTMLGASTVLAVGIRVLVLFFLGLRRRDVEAAGAALFFGLVTFLAWIFPLCFRFRRRPT
jgi:hypothetical protein